MFRNIYVSVYAYIYTTTINEKDAMNLKERKQKYMSRVWRRKGKREVMLYCNLKEIKTKAVSKGKKEKMMLIHPSMPLH